jgi:hypothetical protein
MNSKNHPHHGHDSNAGVSPTPATERIAELAHADEPVENVHAGHDMTAGSPEHQGHGPHGSHTRQGRH